MKNKFLLIIILLVAGLFFGQAHFTKAAIDGGDADYLLYNYGYNNWEDLSYNQRTVVKKVYIQGINNGMTHQQALNESRAVWAGVRDGFNRSEPFNSTILSNIPGVSWNVQKTENGNISVDQNMTNSYHPIVPEENRNFQAILNNRQTNDNDSMNNGSLDQVDNSLQADNPTLIGTNSSNQQNVNNHQATSSQAAGSNAQTNCGEEGLQGVDFLVFHGPLVPCGIDKQCAGGGNGSNEEARSINKTCTLCHFIILIKNIFDLLLSLIITVSLLMLTIAGVLYIVSSGGAMTSLAKGIIEKTLLGFGIFLLSWLIVYTILNLLSVKENGMIGKGTADSWFQFTCDTESSFDKDLLDTQTQNPDNTQTQNPDNTQIQNPDNTQTHNPTPPILTPTQPSTTEEQARATVNDNVTIPRDACHGTGSTRATNCVSLVGAKPQTIQGMNNLANGCKSYNPNCVVQINSVTDRIINPNTGETYYNTVHSGDANCTYCHHSGDKVDYQANSTLNTYLTGRATRSEIENIPVGSTTSGGILTRIGTRTSPPSGPKFRDVNNNVWVYEAGNGSSGGHWDVCYAGSACPEHSSS